MILSTTIKILDDKEIKARTFLKSQKKLTTGVSRSFFRSKIFFFPDSIVNEIPGRELSMTEAVDELSCLELRTLFELSFSTYY